MFRPETPQSLSQVPWEDDQQLIEEPGTPDSVIRHPIEHTREETPEIPEVEATIRAPGSGLKTRNSISRREIEAINDEDEPPLPLPARDLGRPSSMEPLARPSSSDSRPKSSDFRPKSADLNMEAMKLDLPVSEVGGLGLDAEFDRVIEAQKVAPLSFTSPTSPAFTSSAHFPPSSAEHVDGTAYSPHNKRLSANQTYRTQKGYLMRHNTKVVVARSGRDFSDEVKTKVGNGTASDAGQASVTRDGTKLANSSPRKASESKPYQTMPWDSKVRRKSIRTASGEVRKKAKEGPAPPLPGMESAVNGLGALEETNGDDEWEEGTERGRLFVKVIGVKDLDLPLPKHERTNFQLTLDNGLHCVTTSWLELGRSAPIGQEFELVVLNDLEFQLTLQTKLTPPQKPAAAPVPSPTKAPASPTKGSMSKSKGFFSSLAMSPKKRREQERLLKEEAERQAQQEARETQRRQQEEASRRQQQQRNAGPATAWDLLHTLVGGDGSFARAYISLKSHERSCFGRPFVVDIPCYNEWALEDNDRIVSSVKSKQRGHGPVRRPPYEVGKLQLQLLYVPKPKGTREEEMPKSMNAAVREMREAEEVKERSWEGILSQQGGDCPYWRRRFFKLTNSKLTAYHETSHQPRATINLAKASKLIDDKRSLVSDDNGGNAKKSGGRRKSAFAEEEEGYMFVEEGFRLRFSNGETIDFYADSREQKDGWMKVLSEVVGKQEVEGKKSAWSAAVLAHEAKYGKPEQAREVESLAAVTTSATTGQQQQQQQQQQRPAGHARTKSVPDPSSWVAGKHSKATEGDHDRLAPQPPSKETPSRYGPQPRQSASGQRERRDNVRSMIY
ncbi:hypothetical protein LTS18_011783 [Coniosporium uncinatum]|uniref:Uncharacterized protein n=1 Tax=Coniosporium uncinatum TaxID=93489 RepID=A0ACC3DWG7_9PEZI|nr:hypothetical protein LTS18_011783 [Coniosporium uncinatum]